VLSKDLPATTVINKLNFKNYLWYPIINLLTVMLLH
jgi:hypothetical protein